VTSGLRLLKQTPFGFSAITFNIGNRRGIGKLPYENLGTPFASSASLRKAFEEATLLHIGRAFQRATDWHKRTPDLGGLFR